MAAGEWDAHTGASWKGRLCCCSLLPWDPWEPEKYSYPEEMSVGSGELVFSKILWA